MDLSGKLLIAMPGMGDPRFEPGFYDLPTRHADLTADPLCGFVEVPESEHWIGTRPEDVPNLIKRFGGDEDLYKRETPQHRVWLSRFFIARYPITVAVLVSTLAVAQALFAGGISSTLWALVVFLIVAYTVAAECDEGRALLGLGLRILLLEVDAGFVYRTDALMEKDSGLSKSER